MLIGQWKTQEWVEAKTNKAFENLMDFTFSGDMRYEVDYGSHKEIGNYWIEGDFLHTIEDNQAEKKVKFLLLTSDSLKIEMNRSGRIEHVSFIRNK